jgi:hypothetical protein
VVIQLTKSSDIQTAAILIFVVSFVVGGIFSMWPGKVQELDIRMSPFFRAPEAHRAFIKGCGFILLGLAAASLLAAIVS